MEAPRDELDLAAELRGLRPTPRQTFVAELDARAAAGFPPNPGSTAALRRRLMNRLASFSPRRAIAPAGAMALLAIVVATALVTVQDSPDRDLLGQPASPAVHDASGAGAAREAGRGGSEKASSGVQSSSGVQYSDSAAPPTVDRLPTKAGHRKVERDAELILRAQPDEFGEATREVFATVHAVDGIVLSSSIHDRVTGAGDAGAGEASARFELLIPSAQLGSALASLSQIADVRSRRESTLDITAPTIGASERLRDSRARIDSLLAQLAGAESDEERAAVEAELRGERRNAAVLRSQLERLRQRAHFARVSLRIESGASPGASGSGRWGVDDALDDAGRLLAIAAGVTVIGLALLAPVALILLLAWLAHRALLRYRRERALR